MAELAPDHLAGDLAPARIRAAPASFGCLRPPHASSLPLLIAAPAPIFSPLFFLFGSAIGEQGCGVLHGGCGGAGESEEYGCGGKEQRGFCLDSLMSYASPQQQGEPSNGMFFKWIIQSLVLQEKPAILPS